MKQVSLKSLFVQGIFNAWSPLRFNENSYAYVTLYGTKNGETSSNNVYFTIRGSESMEGIEEGTDISHLLQKSDLLLVQNSDEKGNEDRFKIQLPNDNGIIGKSQLAELFGVEQVMDFDVPKFRKEFKTKAESEAGVDENEEGSDAREELQPKLKSNVTEAPAAGGRATVKAPVVKAKVK